MFSCVWLHFKKFSGKNFLVFGKEEGKNKPKKKIINDRDPRSRSRRRDLDLHEIAILDRGRRTGAREIGADWSSEFAGDRRTDWSSVFSSRTHALSLSLFFRKYFEVKMEVENDFRGQRHFFSVNGFQFPENRIFRTNQIASFPEVIFTQNKHTLRHSFFCLR